MKALKVVTLSAAALAFTSFDAVAQTWICDSKKVTGFDSDEGYEVITYRNRSYRVVSGIDKSFLTFEHDKEKFDRLQSSGLGPPAGIVQIGQSLTSLCDQASDVINCNWIQPFGGQFRLSLATGLYSRVKLGFELGGGSVSIVEVGECRRIN